MIYLFAVFATLFFVNPLSAADTACPALNGQYTCPGIDAFKGTWRVQLKQSGDITYYEFYASEKNQTNIYVIQKQPAVTAYKKDEAILSFNYCDNEALVLKNQWHKVVDKKIGEVYQITERQLSLAANGDLQLQNRLTFWRDNQPVHDDYTYVCAKTAGD